MPQLLIDNFDVPGLWSARDALNAPSVEIALSATTDTHPFATDASSLRVDIQTGATGHLIRRTIPAVDLNSFDSLTLWHRADVAAAGDASDPLRVRLALGSAALPVGAPGNDWVRYLTADTANVWSYSVLALDDLPTAVRGAIQTIEFQIVTVSASHALHLDGLEAQVTSVAADIDAALLARLDAQLVLGGGPVPATIAPSVPPAPGQPAIRLVQYEAVRNEVRSNTGPRRTDFTETGHRLRPSPIPWDIYYRVEFVAADRADQAAMVDFVIGGLGHRMWLPVGNRALRLEQVDQVKPDDAVIDAPSLRYRVSAWIERGADLPVVPVGEVVIDTDLNTPARAAGGV